MPIRLCLLIGVVSWFVSPLVGVWRRNAGGGDFPSAHFPELVLLDREAPRGVLLAEPDAPVERARIDVRPVEGGRDQVVLGLHHRLRDCLAVAAYVLHLVRHPLPAGRLPPGRCLAVAASVLHLVRPPLPGGVLRPLRADRDPVDPLRQLEAAVGLDRPLGAPGGGLTGTQPSPCGSSKLPLVSIASL